MRRKPCTFNNDALLQAIIECVPNCSEIFFHGSRATGNYRPSSDWDLLVVIDSDAVSNGSAYFEAMVALREIGEKYSDPFFLRPRKVFDVQPCRPGCDIFLIAKEEGVSLWRNPLSNQGRDVEG